MMSNKARLALAVMMISALAACKSGVKLDDKANNAGAVSTQPSADNVAQVNVDPLNDPNSPLAKRSIYFDFDSYSVKDEYQPLLQQHAQYLKSHPQRHVLIQGKHRRTRHQRVQPRAGPEACGSRPPRDGAARRERLADGSREPRQGKAAGNGPRRSIVGAEPSRRPRLPTVSNGRIAV